MATTEGDATTKASTGLRRALIRPLRDGETRPLIALQQDVQTAFGDDATSSAELIQSTRATKPDGMSDAEFASWIVVANTILNLDEFLTKN
jgi:hypothetical protein